MKKKIALITILFSIITILIFSDKIVNFIINLEWYKEVGYLSIYFTRVSAILKLMIPIFLTSYIAIVLYYRSLKKSIIKWKKVIEVNSKKNKLERRIFTICNLLISFMLSYVIASNYWYRILQFANSTDFNVKDPIFNIDVSFYVFKLPLMESLYGTVMFLLIFLVVATFIAYFILNAKDKITFGREESSLLKVKRLKSGITKFAGKQLAILSALILLMLSLGYLIKGWNLVYSLKGVAFGAGYTDVHVSLLFYRVIAAVSLIASIITFMSVLRSKVKPIVISIVVIISLIICQSLASVVVEDLIVKSNEKLLESPYIKNNIEYTRKAFNIDTIEDKKYDVKDMLTKEDIAENTDTINNIKLNSFSQALEFYNQVQVIRYYYNFNDVDVDRYNLNGKLTQVFVAPREIEQKALEGNADTWQNKHMNYTHGYGVVMNKVNSVTKEGQPDFVIDDIPPDNKTNIALDNARIYFGEDTSEYAIVNTPQGEFDYPKGGGDENYKYNGKAGLETSLINRVLFAINQRDINFITSTAMDSNSKIIINRNIMDRVKKIAPFLTYDNDPYSVISNGKVYWIIDAYTTSDRYPFSQPESNINYIRNSVKVIIDAFDGDVNFYLVDKNDPVAKSYSRIFKGLFKDVNSVPEDLKAHFRYPEDLFNIQCKVLGKYHVTDSGVFYNGEDLWEVSENQKQVEGEKSLNDASYTVMRLPGQSKEEMVLLEYFNMRDKDNMVAIFGARMDGENYGKMVLYRLPTQKTIYSPYLFKQNLKQDPVISKEVSLWDTQGSKVQFGDTSIIPINNSLLYVEPMYLRAQGKNSIPEVKRVVVSNGNKVVLAEDIQDALKQLFDYNDQKTQSTAVVSQQTEAASNVNEEKLKQAKDLYDKAVEAQKNGDWAKYGEYIKNLGDLLEQLNK